MRTSLIGAALVGILTAGASFARSPVSTGFLTVDPRPSDAEGGVGGGGVRVATAVGSGAPFLTSESQSLFVAVGEGGEGGEGGRGKRRAHRAPRFYSDGYR